MLVLTVILAALTFALALRVRSWPIWLAAFALLLLALVIAWSARSTPTMSAFITVSWVHA